jgi:hypothetical protein
MRSSRTRSDDALTTSTAASTMASTTSNDLLFVPGGAAASGTTRIANGQHCVRRIVRVITAQHRKCDLTHAVGIVTVAQAGNNSSSTRSPTVSSSCRCAAAATSARARSRDTSNASARSASSTSPSPYVRLVDLFLPVVLCLFVVVALNIAERTISLRRRLGDGRRGAERGGATARAALDRSVVLPPHSRRRRQRSHRVGTPSALDHASRSHNRVFLDFAMSCGLIVFSFV